MTRPWTDEADAELRALWADPGMTSQTIGERLGVSGNAVIGRAHRLNLPVKAAGRTPKDRPKMVSAPWTAERVAEMVRLWREGKSGTQIARSLGGVTRHAVLTKAARLQLRRDPTTISVNCRRAKPMATPTLKLAADVEMPPMSVWSPLPGVTPVRFLEARRAHCRWPIEFQGADEPHVCGAKITLGSWCETHNKIGRPGAGTKESLDQRIARDVRKAA